MKHILREMIIKLWKFEDKQKYLKEAKRNDALLTKVYQIGWHQIYMWNHRGQKKVTQYVSSGEGKNDQIQNCHSGINGDIKIFWVKGHLK